MKQPTIEKIICCDKCDKPLWRLKILSHFGDKVGSTQWNSLNPSHHEGEPKSMECPLCSREFTHTHKPSGRKGLVLADPETGRKKMDWITG